MAQETGPNHGQAGPKTERRIEMKATFRHSIEWSDWSEHSPNHHGQLPCAVILPDGERIALDDGALYQAQSNLFYARMERRSRATYAQIHPNVRVREDSWGDDGSRRMGRAGSTMEVLAPKGSRFVFNYRCPYCGEESGECEESELRGGQADPLWHESCKAEDEEQERGVEEHRRYVEEQERLADEEWEREFGDLLAE
jgi:hypothetical protein